MSGLLYYSHNTGNPQKNLQGFALLDKDSFLYWRKEGSGLTKRSRTIEYRVNSNMSDIIEKTFAEVRRKCKKPNASSSQINRALWRAITSDDNLRKRVICAVCDFIQNMDTSV